MQYECGNAFPNLKCVPEPFFLEKSSGKQCVLFQIQCYSLNTYVILQLLLSLSVTFCRGERPFSVLRRIKTFLRTCHYIRRTTERIGACMVLHCIVFIHVGEGGASRAHGARRIFQFLDKHSYYSLPYHSR